MLATVLAALALRPGHVMVTSMPVVAATSPSFDHSAPTDAGPAPSAGTDHGTAGRHRILHRDRSSRVRAFAGGAWAVPEPAIPFVDYRQAPSL
jgi:hypothetical protein